MLNALSSTLKSDSDDQSRNAAAEEAERRGVRLDRVDRAQDRVDRRARERALQLAHEERVSVRLVGEPEQREREEQQRHEREQREVGDHRREVRAAVGEELARAPQPRAVELRRLKRARPAVCSGAWTLPRRWPT